MFRASHWLHILCRIGDVGLLRSLAVRHDCRKAGLARVLVEEARRRYRGIRSLYLLTTTAADFFAHIGFAIIPREAAPLAIRDGV
jgi:N-acetylglutamate synthase-like GNAT family acetyltransferase